jgi:hypothetical protein
MSLLPWVFLLSLIAGIAVGFQTSFIWGLGVFFILWGVFGSLLETPEEKELAKKMASYAAREISSDEVAMFLQEQSASIEDMPQLFREFVVAKVEELGEEDASLFFRKFVGLTKKETLQVLLPRQYNQLRLLMQMGKLDEELALLIERQPDSDEYLPKVFAAACVRYAKT